jgi:hypothetical protein
MTPRGCRSRITGGSKPAGIRVVCYFEATLFCRPGPLLETHHQPCPERTQRPFSWTRGPWSQKSSVHSLAVIQQQASGIPDSTSHARPNCPAPTLPGRFCLSTNEHRPPRPPEVRVSRRDRRRGRLHGRTRLPPARPSVVMSPRGWLASAWPGSLPIRRRSTRWGCRASEDNVAE